jgi:hypothetical protein
LIGVWLNHADARPQFFEIPSGGTLHEAQSKVDTLKKAGKGTCKVHKLAMISDATHDYALL